MPSETTNIKLPGTPTPWMNATVMLLLRTPGLRSLLGKQFLILGVTGAKTGATYTLPVQYARDGDRLIVLSQRTRRWWRNLHDRPEVEIVVRGRSRRAIGSIADDDEAAEAIATMLRRDHRTARFYGIAIGEDGEPDADGIVNMMGQFVAIVIDQPVDDQPVDAPRTTEGS